MNLRWFYVSLVCLFVVLFNHTVLPVAVPARIVATPTYWIVVIAIDAVAFIAAFVMMLMALFLRPRSEGGAGTAAKGRDAGDAGDVGEEPKEPAAV